MKKSVGIFSTICLIFAVLMVSNITQQKTYALSSGDYQYTVTNGNAAIIGYTGAGGNITIPSTVDGYPVTSIGAYSFDNNEFSDFYIYLTSVIIPDSVTSIGEGAFSNTSLTSVTIPDSVTSIGAYAFRSTNLTSVTIPNSITKISDYLFYNCDYLTSMTIPNSVFTIGDGAFRSCDNLVSVTIPDSVTGIGDYAFERTSLASVTIPDSVINIGSNAFRSTRLTSVTIPNSITKISDYMFYNCNYLASITIPNSVISIGNYAFYRTKLTNITIPNSVTTIGESAFVYCSQLESIDIPNSVTRIGSRAFAYSNLSKARFFVNAPSMGYGVFFGCSSSLKIYYWGRNKAFNNPWQGYPTEPFWISPYIVTYDGNGNTSGAVPVDNRTYLQRENVSVLGNTRSLSNTGYTFSGWNTKANGTGISYTPGDILNVETTDVKLYAKWNINKYTVTFNSQGGSEVQSITANYNSIIKEPTAPTRSGYEFNGWYKDAYGKIPWIFATDKVTADIKLYGRWITIPGAPTGVSAKSAGYNSIKISWNSVSYAGGYEVYRSTSNVGPYSLISTTTSTSYTNKGLNTGTTYYYKVRAYRTVGTKKVYGEYSAASSAIPVPTAPASIKAASSGDNSIGVSWSAVPGASGYSIYKLDSSTENYSLLATTTATSYTNKGLGIGFTYYYKVRAYTIVGTKKVYGEYSVVAGARQLPSVTASVTAASAGYNSIKISWSPVAGASSYSICRSTSSGGAYVWLANTTSTDYTNTNLTTGFTYYYKVRAYTIVENTKVSGIYSAVVSARPVPSTPTNLTAKRESSTSIKLAWNSVSGASGYEIYKATSSTGSYSLLKDTTSLYYTNTRLTTGKPYYYKVRAYKTVNGTKVYGNWTSVAYTKP